jgi:hypothetical protein
MSGSLSLDASGTTARAASLRGDYVAYYVMNANERVKPEPTDRLTSGAARA